MIEKNLIQAVVMSAGQPACRALGQWLSRHGLDWRYGSQDYGIDNARNQNVRRFLAQHVPSGKTHLLMIDHDMVPIAASEPILSSEGDLLYCGYVDRFGSPGHHGAGNFGAACFRASARLLAAMADPWFQMLYSQGRRYACECTGFRVAAAALGYEAQMVGIVGHEQRCVLFPGPDAASSLIPHPSSFSLRWPPECEDGPHT